jgi:hypothetical protein
MPIQLDYTVPSTGALSSYHAVNVVTLSYDGSEFTMATVASYVSKDAKDAGRQALYQQQIQIDGLPTGDPRAFCEAALIAAKPTDGSADAFPIRYTFAGGTIVD